MWLKETSTRLILSNPVKEEKFLHQIRLEEQFGPIVNKAIEEEKKALAPKKAAIAFTYTEDADSEEKEKPDSSGADAALAEGGEEAAGDGSDEESDSDIDLGELMSTGSYMDSYSNVTVLVFDGRRWDYAVMWLLFKQFEVCVIWRILRGWK